MGSKLPAGEERMQDDSPVAGGPVGRRDWKWVSVQGSADLLWGCFFSLSLPQFPSPLPSGTG